MKLVDDYVREIQGGNLQKATEIMLHIIAADPSGETRRQLDRRFGGEMSDSHRHLESHCPTH
ncbi:hypothetical protein [Motilimonas sp. KMU-193]|uniref:hypothetical protein n=1 Tax=Motilimonas sp. KMU-193 TaxID=3388668 RepID=UPI00396B2F3D